MTDDDRALELLRQRPDLAELAVHPFNVDLARDEHGEAVRLASGPRPAPHGCRRGRGR